MLVTAYLGYQEHQEHLVCSNGCYSKHVVCVVISVLVQCQEERRYAGVFAFTSWNTKKVGAFRLLYNVLFVTYVYITTTVVPR